MDAFGYTMLQKPLQALNMVYPNKSFDDNSKVDAKILLGSDGLKKNYEIYRNNQSSY